MNRLNRTFNSFITAHKAVKKAKRKIKLGEITSDELFDIEYYLHEKELEFLLEVKKH